MVYKPDVFPFGKFRPHLQRLLPRPLGWEAGQDLQMRFTDVSRQRDGRVGLYSMQSATERSGREDATDGDCGGGGVQRRGCEAG